jgi:tRNA pseudouridine55 synthase
VAESIHGALVVYKPVGPSSHDIVVCARRALGVSRIGHTGTLDPQAAGVLPLVVGQATRLAQYLTGSDKEYLATIRFGLSTDTYDATGRVVSERGGAPTLDALEAALDRFRGTFDQSPPAYSAKMVAGERAYVLARAGQAVAPPPATVTAHELSVVEFDGVSARVRIHCSAGFYVRSLAHDIGEAVGTGAVLDALIRTRAAGFETEAALPFEQLMTLPRHDVRAAVRPMETLLTEVPAATLTSDGVEWARNGRELPPRILTGPPPARGGLVRLLAPDGRFVGLAAPATTPGLLRPTVIFSYN